MRGRRSCGQAADMVPVTLIPQEPSRHHCQAVVLLGVELPLSTNPPMPSIRTTFMTRHIAHSSPFSAAVHMWVNARKCSAERNRGAVSRRRLATSRAGDSQ